MLNSYTYNFPTTIRFGPGVIKELGTYLKSVGKEKPLFITDPALAQLPLFTRVVENLKKEGLHGEVFSDIAKNPVKSNVLQGVDCYKENNRDSLIGFGGGVAMDVARAIGLKVNHPLDLFEYEDSKGGEKLITEDIPHFVTIPTTSGTGSEVGRSAVISEEDTHEKRILFSPRLMAQRVFADPELTLELPASITAATGLDALTHNIEAYCSLGFHPLCDGIALEGIRLIAESIEKATLKPDLKVRSKMMMAALMGAVAFQKGLGVVHSTAHPLSTLFDLHHGLANAIMLRYGVEFNAAICETKIITMAQVIGLKNPGVDSFLDYLKALNKKIGLPLTLNSQGIEEDAVAPLSKLAFQDVCHQCNPKPVSEEDFKLIYKKALK